MLFLLISMSCAYLIGSIPTAYIIGKKVKKIDIRQHGSGNVGSTNVFRVVGKKWGITALLLDVLKGVVSVGVAGSFLYQMQDSIPWVYFGMLTGVAAIAGHNWTVFLNFKGGKGVATSLGVALAILPKAGLSSLAVFLLVLAVSRYISISSICAAFAFPVWVFLFYRAMPGSGFLILIALALAVLIVYMHRSNIDRLKKGTENRLGGKKPQSS